MSAAPAPAPKKESRSHEPMANPVGCAGNVERNEAGVKTGQVNRDKEMSATADIAIANHWSRVIEQAEAKRLSISVEQARPSAARRVGASPGTFENIRRLRLKSIPSWLLSRIRAEFIAVLQTEMRRLEHEIQLARKTGESYSDDVLVAAETQIAAVRSLLNSEKL